jgi:hypothetical protein
MSSSVLLPSFNHTLRHTRSQGVIGMAIATVVQTAGGLF